MTVSQTQDAAALHKLQRKGLSVGFSEGQDGCALGMSSLLVN